MSVGKLKYKVNKTACKQALQISVKAALDEDNASLPFPSQTPDRPLLRP